MNLSKKHLKHLQYLRDRVTDDVCYKCGCYDSDYGCTSGRDSWYWCPFEIYIPKNYQDAHEMYNYYSDEKFKAKWDKRYKRRKRRFDKLVRAGKKKPWDNVW